jgi:PAS domain S-box-containing protein
MPHNINTDVTTTQGKQKQEKFGHIHQLPEENPNPVLSADLNGSLVYANEPARTWLKSLGWGPGVSLPEPVTRLAADAVQQKVVREISCPNRRVLLFTAIRPQGEDYVNLYGTDISERKQAEEALKKAHEEFEMRVEERTAELQKATQILNAIFKNSPDLLFAKDCQSRLIYASDSTLRVLGKSAAEAFGKTDTETHPDPRLGAAVMENDRIVRETRQPLIAEEPTQLADGSVRIYLSKKIPWMAADGTLLGTLGIATDITERKQAEMALQELNQTLERRIAEKTVSLRESEERLRLLGDNLPDSVVYQCLYNPDGDPKFLYISAGVKRLRGVSAQDALRDPNTLRSQIPPEYLERVITEEKRSISELSDFDMDIPMRLPDGQERWVRIHSRPRRMPDGSTIWDGVQTDITDRKKAEQALQRSEASLKRAQEIAHLGSWELDLDANRLTWSDEVYRIFGLQPQEFSATYEAFLERVHPNDRAAVDAAYSGSVREGRDSYEIEHRVVRKDTGEVRHVQEKCQHIRDNQGRIVSSIGMVLDITERKAAEEALRESEARLSAISEASFDGIIIHGNSKIIEVNEAFANMYGYTVPELVGKPLLDLYVQESHDVISYHVGNGLENPYEVTAIRKDGSRFLAEVRGRNTIYKGMKVRGGTHRDITERKRAEEELRRLNENLEKLVDERTEKLRRLAGELTLVEQRERKQLGRILHDGLQQYLVAAKMQLNGLHERIQNEGRKQEAHAIGHLLDEAVQVSRNLAAELSPPILHDGGIVAGLEWLSRWTLQKHGLKVRVVNGAEAPLLAEDVKVLVFECVRELLLNVVKHSGVREAEIRLCRTQDELLQVTVEDNGRGFDPALLNACPSLDTGGYGLFSIRERIQLSGGDLEAYSTPGKGARLTLTVPIANIDRRGLVQPDQLKCTPIAVKSSTGKIRILLTDDHVVMREGLARLLSQEPDMEIVGQAADGQEAVEFAGQLVPDIILMDHSMPILNGTEATRIIHQQHPVIQIIGLSLYTEEERAREMIEAVAAFYLSKAGPPSELKAAIRACYRKNQSHENVRSIH